jgi:hypothetical protein
MASVATKNATLWRFICALHNGPEMFKNSPQKNKTQMATKKHTSTMPVRFFVAPFLGQVTPRIGVMQNHD